jgi:hypothetical protein
MNEKLRNRVKHWRIALDVVHHFSMFIGPTVITKDIFAKLSTEAFLRSSTLFCTVIFYS